MLVKFIVRTEIFIAPVAIMMRWAMDVVVVECDRRREIHVAVDAVVVFVRCYTMMVVYAVVVEEVIARFTVWHDSW